MAPRSIVEAFDVRKDIPLGFLTCCIMLVMDEFGFERVEEALHRSVVIAIGLAAHRSPEAGGLHQDRHRSREFIELLRLIDAAYPPNTAIKLILDNHSAHISRETRAWLATRPSGRFELTFTPKHGSWLHSLSGVFSPLAASLAIPSSTRGPTSSPRPPDMIRTKKTLT